MIFGTDGIRGLVSSDIINERSFFKFGNMFGNYIGRGKTILVSFDTRESSSYLCMSFISGLLMYSSVHITKLPISILSEVIIRSQFIDAGAMITASHNTYEFNGIKFLNKKGEKIHFKNKKEKPLSYGKYLGELDYNEDFYHIKDVLFDCNHGAMSYLKLPNVFNNNFNGRNINIGKEIRQNKGYVARFDGDGDRLSLYKDGKIINSDCIIATLGQYANTIIGTKCSSLALERFCKERKIKFIRSDVGDMNVYKEMKKHNTYIGGEPSGHIIYKSSISNPIRILEEYIKCNNKIFLKYDYSEEIAIEYKENNIKLFKRIENKYKKENRNIIIRKSGTENLFRIKVETESKKLSQEIMNLIVYELSNS